MSTLLQHPRSPFGHPGDSPSRRRSMAIVPPDSTSPKSDTRMSSPPPSSMGPPNQSSPETEHQKTNGNREQSHTPVPGTSAAGAAQGPKVVQTAFIHKLYSMLEDRTIQHLISWSNNNDSFVMSPSNEFSKVLAQYFKHTNISSFVRQLNMYGFHKVSDVFHTGSPESALWEFKHGNGNFKKGDLMGLREIKRRASRHTLIHRDSFSNAKPPGAPSQPGTPAEMVPDTDQRLAHLEYALGDVHNRLSRSEESHSLLSSRCQALTESLTRCHQWMTTFAGAIQPVLNSEPGLYNDIVNMQKEISRQLDYVRALEQPSDSLMNGRPSFYPGGPLEPPLSPRGYGYPDSRRSSVQIEPQHVGIRPPVPPIPPQFASSPRRFGSISASQASPGFSRPALPPQAQQNVHPLASVVTPPLPPGLARRHTSADIREHWPQPNPNGSPYVGQPSSQWQQPVSPSQPSNTGDLGIRDQLAKYEINGARRQTVTQTSPLAPEGPPSGLGVENVSWSVGSKFPRSTFELHSAPATRRSSMASNVHSLLNPTAEREEEEEGGPDDRKRKRLQ